MQRAQTFYITTTGTTDNQETDLVFFDKAKSLDINGIHVGASGGDVQVTLTLDGNKVAVLDDSLFAAGNPRVHIAARVSPQNTVTIGIKDLAGTAHTNLPVTIFYDVAP